MGESIVCNYCGARTNFLKSSDGSLVCAYCGTIIDIQEDLNKEQVVDLLSEKTDTILSQLDSNKEKLLSNSIYNLREELDKQFPNNKLVISFSNEIKKYISNHFLANVFELVATKNYIELNDYLSNFDYDSIPNELIEYVIDKLLANVDSSIELTLSTIIENVIKDQEKQFELFTKLEKEIDKCNSATYECSLPRDIFVAHSSKDYKETNEIVNYLEEMGYTCWVSSRNLKHGINASATYDENIKLAIDNCSVFLLIGSKNSRNRSCDAYKIEMQYLNIIDKATQPLNLQNIPMEKWDIQYKKRRTQYMLSPYSEPMNPFDTYTKKLFNGFQNCVDKNQLVNVIEEMLNDELLESSQMSNIVVENKVITEKKDEHVQSNKEQNSGKLSYSISSTITTSKPAYLRSGDSIEFGLYPQTKVKDIALKATLNKKAGMLPTTSNSQSWTSYGYYIEGSVSNYMWYIDIEEGGEKYRGVYFTQYRPEDTTNSSSISNSNQDDNGYIINIVYWFKYEPIKWTIVEEENGYATLVCDIAIDSQEYYSSVSEESHYHNGGTGYSNNYALSNIRKWLNETFYNTAFNALQKAIIQTTEVDNSLASVGFDSNKYICENTNDKVYLLSFEEADTYYKDDTSRQKKCTDYAKAQGCYSPTDNSDFGNCFWGLRTPDEDGGCNVWTIAPEGDIFSVFEVTDDIVNVGGTYSGVVPALKIKL